MGKRRTLLLLLLLLLLLTNTTTADLTSQELDAALFALRSSGYSLFPNAITTSDLYLRLLSSPQPQNSSFFTLFAPPDSLLFSLDLLSSATLYTFSLLHHVSPHFFSRSDLLSLPRPSYIETLLPARPLYVENTLVSRNATVVLSVSVDGVLVSGPDLFLGSNIAVHGLSGILVARYGLRISEATADFNEPEPPKSWCETCISPANSPEILPPFPVVRDEAVTMDTAGVKRHVGSNNDDDGSSSKDGRRGRYFRFKRLFSP